MFMLNYNAIGWWYWLGTACLLVAGLGGEPAMFHFVIGLTIIHALHFMVRDRSVTSLSVQIRLAALLVFFMGLHESMRVLYWLTTAGLSARILFGYCLLGRMLSLFPWNRGEPFSAALVRQTLLAPPTQTLVRQDSRP